MKRFIPSILLFTLFTNCTETEVLKPVATINLNDNWEFRKVGDSTWHSATIPGVVHTDLLANEFIEDPYWRNNELDLQWIENEDWEYRTTIIADKKLLDREHVEINFDGLDTYAQVSLNDRLILETNNMFRSWTVELSSLLKLGDNKLTVLFLSPIKVNKPLFDSLGYQLPAGCETVDTKISPFTRKAAYHFGWDWGPRFVTCGIWRPVSLKLFDAAILDGVKVVTKEINEDYAIVEYHIDYSAGDELAKQMHFRIGDKKYLLDDVDRICIDTIFNPELWWPSASGLQKIYSTPISIVFGETVLDSTVVQFGLRSIELINEPDSIGTSFYFKVNGEPTFMKGANYIPQDMFLPRVTNKQYKELLIAAKDAGMNMLRVWGGGIYENDIFYDLCDSLGLLVWQDFMFAGSMYPSDADFLENIKVEAEQNVARLQNHPCIALWCGNNEMNVAWHNWGWQKQYNYSPTDSAKIWNNYLNIFDTILRNVVSKNGMSYVSTSPQSNWGTPENFNHGSMHYWGVWHGREELGSYADNVGRFMVEYGFQSFPCKKTILSYTDSSDWKWESDVMANRQKSYVGNDEMLSKMGRPNCQPTEFWTLIENTLKTQATALEIAIYNHLNSNGHCMGTLFWQLNDCWPGPSWSVIDYYGEKKAAYSSVQQLFLENE
ncbi:MAG: glycoside hydrolase family 2 protein [Flavobacteriales bacterium]|nr:glycoside hydrolase family 2 protein [Flavobacteriales bacterium]